MRVNFGAGVAVALDPELDAFGGFDKGGGLSDIGLRFSRLMGAW
jgi:hypothetical protein